MTDEDIRKIVEALESTQKDIPIKKDNKKKKGWFSKLIILISVSFAMLYTLACLYILFVKGTSPDPQLTISVFAFFGVELLNCATIKKAKDKNKKEDD